ncbi:MAG: DNA repair protein RecO C-terminal domain-containing protein [Clostridia bacterium]
MALKAEGQDDQTIAMTFAMRSVSDNGFRPQIDHCDMCGRPVDEGSAWAFIIGRGALICPDCQRKTQEYGKRVSATVLRALKYIVTSPVDRVYRFAILPEFGQELASLVEEYVVTHTGQNYASLNFMKKNLL